MGKKGLNIPSYQGNTNQNYKEISSHLRIAVIKQQKLTNAGKNIEQKESLSSAGKNKNLCGHYGEKVVLPKNEKQNYHMIQLFHPSYIQKE